MPQKTELAWEEQILALKGADPRMGETRLHTKLELDFSNGLEPQQAGPPPSPATVRRVLKRRWEVMVEADRARYRLLYWPESFERCDLPWEAAPAALELARYLHGKGLGRPMIGVARWFWRVTQAAPDALFADRLRLMRHSISAEPQNEDLRRRSEWELAYAPWRTEENQIDWNFALNNTEGRKEAIPAERPIRLEMPAVKDEETVAQLAAR